MDRTKSALAEKYELVSAYSKEKYQKAKIYTDEKVAEAKIRYAP